MPLHVFAKALGSAIYGAVAAGIYPDAAEAARHMGSGCCAVYQPVAENVAVYEKLYAEYKILHADFKCRTMK